VSEKATGHEKIGEEWRWKWKKRRRG